MPWKKPRMPCHISLELVGLNGVQKPIGWGLVGRWNFIAQRGKSLGWMLSLLAGPLSFVDVFLIAWMVLVTENSVVLCLRECDRVADKTGCFCCCVRMGQIYLHVLNSWWGSWVRAWFGFRWFSWNQSLTESWIPPTKAPKNKSYMISTPFYYF